MSQYDITFEVFAANPRNVNEFKKDYYKRIGDIVLTHIIFLAQNVDNRNSFLFLNL